MRSDEIPRTFSMILDLQKGTLSFDFGGGHIDEAFTGTNNIPLLISTFVIYPEVHSLQDLQ